MEKKCRGAQPTGRLKVRPIMVRTPKPGSPLDVTWLSDLPFGLMLHWEKPGKSPKGRHLPHLDADCPHCVLLPLEWRGYVAVWDHNANDLGMVPLTETAFTNFRAWGQKQGGIRGNRCILMRSTPNRCSAYYFSTTSSMRLRPVPAEPDLRPHLSAIYPHAAHLIWGERDQLEGGQS